MHRWLEGFDDKVFRSLLFLFTSCHEIVIATPKARLDIGWLTTLRRLEQARPMVAAASTNNTARENTRLQPGRFIPNLSFLFRYPHAFFQAVSRELDDPASSGASVCGNPDVSVLRGLCSECIVCARVQDLLLLFFIERQYRSPPGFAYPISNRLIGPDEAVHTQYQIDLLALLRRSIPDFFLPDQPIQPMNSMVKLALRI